jgi:dihydrofolate reductase
LIENDLVDEYRLMVHPIATGKGKRLFRDAESPTKLKLVASTTTTTGVLSQISASVNGCQAPVSSLAADNRRR